MAPVSIRPAVLSAAKSIASPLTESSLYSSTSDVSPFMRERKPTFGRRRCIGIWPPSKPGLTLPLPVRAYWPLWPRPAVLPRPEPIPRPTRTRTLREPLAGLRLLRRMWMLRVFRRGAPLSARPRHSGVFFDAHEVADLFDQSAHLRRILQLAHVVQLVQAERFHA